MQPTIMVMGCASPDGAGVVEVSDLVDIIGPHAASHTVSSGEQLCVLDDHLGAVLVTVVLGTFLWITIKEEDVHAYIVAGDLPMSRIDELKCWPGYRRVRGKVPGSKGSCKRIGESVYDRTKDLLFEMAFYNKEGKRVYARVNPQALRNATTTNHTANKGYRGLAKVMTGFAVQTDKMNNDDQHHSIEAHEKNVDRTVLNITSRNTGRGKDNTGVPNIDVSDDPNFGDAGRQQQSKGAAKVQAKKDAIERRKAGRGRRRGRR